MHPAKERFAGPAYWRKRHRFAFDSNQQSCRPADDPGHHPQNQRGYRKTDPPGTEGQKNAGQRRKGEHVAAAPGVQDSRPEGSDRQARCGCAGSERTVAVEMQCDPPGLGSMGLTFVAHQLPAQPIARLGWQWPLHHSRLQRDSRKCRGRVAIGGQFLEPLDKTSGNTHQPGGGVIQVDPLEAGSNPGLDGLDDDRMRTFEQAPGGVERGEQAIADKHDLVIDGHQPRQGARTGNAMEARTGTFAVMLKLHQFGRHIAGDANDPLAFQRQRQRQLVACQTGGTNAQECPRQRGARFVGGLEHR